MADVIGKLPSKISIVASQDLPFSRKPSEAVDYKVKGATSDLSAATYIIRQENHTLGNALRWMLMKNPKVEFCGVPHPSEDHMQIRIQMYDNQSSLPALIKALDDLDDLFRVVHEKYKTDLAKREYERFNEVG